MVLPIMMLKGGQEEMVCNAESPSQSEGDCSGSHPSRVDITIVLIFSHAVQVNKRNGWGVGFCARTVDRPGNCQRGRFQPVPSLWSPQGPPCWLPSCFGAAS